MNPQTALPPTFVGEHGYLDLLQYIMDYGQDGQDRTGVGTRKIAGATLRWDLSRNEAALLTTKRVYWRTFYKELLWFISGSTSIVPLLNGKCSIWSDWPYARYMRDVELKIGLSRPDSYMTLEQFEKAILEDPTSEWAAQHVDLGPVYGYQWRYWEGGVQKIASTRLVGAGEKKLEPRQWKNKLSPGLYSQGDYVVEYETLDQLGNMIDGVINDPFGRRHLVDSWRPDMIQDQALPPCHYAFEVVVSPTTGRINLIFTMRSNDTPIGLPANLAGYALLMHLICRLTKRPPGELIYNGADVHIYHNQFDGVKEHLSRRHLIQRQPVLEIADPVERFEDVREKEHAALIARYGRLHPIDYFTMEDFQVIGYDPALPIKMAVAV